MSLFMMKITTFFSSGPSAKKYSGNVDCIIVHKCTAVQSEKGVFR